MKISELTTGQGNVDVEGSLSEVGETKVFSKFGRELKVSNAILKISDGVEWRDDKTYAANTILYRVKTDDGEYFRFEGDDLGAGDQPLVPNVQDPEQLDMLSEQEENEVVIEDASDLPEIKAYLKANWEKHQEHFSWILK